MDITPANLLRSTVIFAISLALSALTLICLIMAGIWMYDSYQNHKKVEALPIVAQGRLHKFDSMYADGGMRYCYAVLLDNGDYYFREEDNSYSPPPPSPLCRTLLSVEHVKNWKQFVPPKDSDIMSNLFYTVLFILVFGGASFFLGSVLSGIVCLVISPLMKHWKQLSLVATIVIFIPGIVFLKSAWQDVPTYWTIDDYTVKTTRVFITKDGTMYKAPETPMGWTEPSAGRQLSDEL